MAGPVIDTDAGRVRGTRSGRLGVWRSIPYAAAPTGDLRFRAPQPVVPWTGVREATEFGAACPQDRRLLRLGPRTVQRADEDCLSLNVTAPLDAGPPRPVLVFIHGGAYVFGSSATPVYDGRPLAERGDAVIVTINYRLGVFGYLDPSGYSSPDRPLETNLGLRDQIAALEWVRSNIAAFGGDPDAVTIFGESAGGSAVTALMAAPGARGLFHRAIAQSPAVDLVLTSEQSRYFGRGLVELLGADPDDAEAARRALTESDQWELFRAGRRLGGRANRATPGLMPFGPVVDGLALPAHPLDAARAGHTHPVPLVIGTNRDEGTLFPKALDALPQTPERIDRLFARTEPEAQDRILAAYPGYPDADAAIALGADFTLWAPTVEFSAAHAAHAPTFAYRFDYAPPVLHWLGLGATHASELLAVFGYGDSAAGRLLTLPGGRGGLAAVTADIQDRWLGFARTGRPGPDWPHYSAERRITRIFDTVPATAHDPHRVRRLAWAGYRGYRDWRPAA